MLPKFLLVAMLSVLAAVPVFANGTMDELAAAIEREEYRQITSVLVAKDGDIAYEHYFGTGGPAVLNDTRSATKSLTSMAIGAAIQQGALIDENELVYHFFSDIVSLGDIGDLKRSITVRDLLTMSSALDCDDNDETTPGYEDHMHETANWTEFVLALPDMPGYQRDKNGFGPFRYCTAGTFLLGQVIERATGLSVDDFVAQSIFRPLGITKYEWFRSPSGEEQTGGGIRLSARDLWKLAELARADGLWHGRRLLPKGWVETSTTRQVTAGAGQGYGYLWWLDDFTSATTGKKYKAFYMSGNGGNKVVVIPGLKLVTVITATLYNTRGMHQQSADIVEKYILPAYERGAVH